MRIGVRDGAVILESEQVDLKITPDREVWVRRGTPVVYGSVIRWEKAQNYNSIGRKIERGFSREEKQIFLMKLRMAVLKKVKMPTRPENKPYEDSEDNPHEEKKEDDSQDEEAELEIVEDDEEEEQKIDDEDEEKHK